ncbi:MAG: pitrilysin family protein [Clostridiales bacterium]|nr:pitrilysin family protein [Clostridiales bacterium]MDY5468495.1 pitrilysin family protein [Eubacteriales bacterium]
MIEQFTLPNGLRVLCEQLPHLRSVSMGVWVKAGSILEREHENGLSHLIEHMAFKGTGRRSAKQIAQEMDAVGGYLNAATSKLCTCYYAKVIDENLPLAADILSDIVRFPAIDPKELDKERNVVLEEISMTDDSPEDVAYDLIASAMFGKQPLGQTILGPRELIASYTREDILAFRARHYSPMNTCVAIAGNFDLNQVKDLMAQRFGDWTGGAGEIFPVNAVNQRPQTLTADKDTEQAHICLGYRGKPLGDADAYPMAVFNSILGGGMSSRLFQRIREESAMAYSVYSAPSAYPHCGDFTIYAAVSPRNVKTVLAQIDEETSLLVREGATQEEFDMAKAQLKGGFILGQESAYNRMNSMGSNMALMNRVITTDETIRRIEAVTPEDVRRVAAETLGGPRSQAFVGKKIAKYLK